ncbi:MAG: hypothetical protein ABSB69_15250 [Solirubrobacteraceae bacterium]
MRRLETRRSRWERLSVLAFDAFDRVAKVGEGRVECPWKPHNGVPASAAVAVFEPGDVFDTDADAVGKLLLCEPGVMAELAQRSAEGPMVLGVVGLVSRRGIWRPAIVEAVEATREVPTFHVFASEWFERQTLEGGRRGNRLSAAAITLSIATRSRSSICADRLFILIPRCDVRRALRGMVAQSARQVRPVAFRGGSDKPAFARPERRTWRLLGRSLDSNGQQAPLRDLSPGRRNRSSPIESALLGA